jgi:lipid-binding SYLF domain-containing protein
MQAIQCFLKLLSGSQYNGCVNNQITWETRFMREQSLNKFRTIIYRAFLMSLMVVCLMVLVSPSEAKSAREIDAGVDEALSKFHEEMKGVDGFLKKAKGVLIFPSVIKAGIGIGGEYGEGALRVGGKTVAYYNTIAASIGFQLGAQAKSVLLAFMEAEALKKFQTSEGWKVGVDGSVALIKVGMGDSLDTAQYNKPIVAFIFGQQGLMYNLTLEGSKFNKLNK